jgi:NAD(P)-dependent dehydrogenase (short-subunit alcohol dehydrogenase family)
MPATSDRGSGQQPERNVLITGCSSGIGRCLAEGLKARGYRVFATARKPQDVDALTAAGLNGVALDLTSSESIHRAVDTVLARSDGRLYALVNNAGYGQPGAVEDLSRDTLRAQFETNLFGPHELTTRVLPVFRAQNGGRIVQISSLFGIICLPYRGAYNASKFALEALSDTLRLELRGSGIYVSLVEPGPIDTRFRDGSYAAYQATIDPTTSAHRAQYGALERRLLGQRAPAPFILPPEAVLRKVARALQARHPRPRYPVTLPAHAFVFLKRVLPDRVLDTLLTIAGGGGAR